jgi:hypothetical protein
MKRPKLLYGLIRGPKETPALSPAQLKHIQAAESAAQSAEAEIRASSTRVSQADSSRLEAQASRAQLDFRARELAAQAAAGLTPPPVDPSVLSRERIRRGE